MKSYSKLILRLVALFAVLMLGINSIFAQEGESQVRFVHVVPNAVAIDVYINGTLAVKNLDFSEASEYMTVPSGNHTITATAAGLTTALWEQGVTLSADEATTFIASSGTGFDGFVDNLNPTNLGGSRLLLVHALAGGSAVDVSLAEPVTLGGVLQDAGTTIASGLAYATSFGAFDLPSQGYVVDVTAEGATLLEDLELALQGGTSYMAVVYGSANNPSALLLTAATAASEDSGFVRFVHGVFGAPNVDIYINGTLVAPELNPFSPSVHMALPAGDHEVSFAVAGTDAELANTSITVDSGAAQTVAAIASGDTIELSSFEDDLSSVDASTAVASVINSINGSTATVSLSDGTSLSDALEAGEISDAVGFDPVVSGLSFTLTLGDSEGTLNAPEAVFYGGVYYNIVVLAGDTFNAPRLVIAPTSLAQTLGSAPSAGDVSISFGQQDVVATEAPVEVVVTEAAATSVPVVRELPEDVITGEVALDPSANLQLRQYPSPDALSLGLAPSGALLVVIGREGSPVALVEGQPEPPEAADFVDPVTLLGEGEDLDPTQTWLNVTYNTADGGQINAWVLSQYLIIRYEDGDLVELRDLPTYGGNIPGETRNTAVTPPPVPENRVVAIVINLNADANLNLRRTATTDGEILARLPVGTAVELVGFIAPTDGIPFIAAEAEWAFVSYTPAEGGVITGWVSTTFLRYEWRNDTIDAEELFARELVEIVDPETRGDISAGAAPVAAPTQDPIRNAYLGEVVLNEGANLQFRRNPDATSESLGLIPSGSLLIIEVRTAQGDWFRTTFEGQTGWIASQFITVTFNGAFIEDTSEIPVDTSLLPEVVPSATPGS